MALDALIYLVGNVVLAVQPELGFTKAVAIGGAWVSPILGLAMVLFLMLSTRGWGNCWLRCAGLVLLTVSPIVAHAQAVGRPDHQSLLLLLLSVALVGEWKLWERDGCRWRIPTAMAWGLSLWVSLYEPLVLFAAVSLMWVIGDWRRFFSRTRLAHFLTLSAVFVVGMSIEGWPFAWPGGEDFAKWAVTIGELRPATWATVFAWMSWLWPVVVSGALLKREFRAVGFLALVGVALTLWQSRWGAFGVLLVALSLMVFRVELKRRWMHALFVAGVIISFWPVAAAWEAELENGRRTGAMKRAENLALEDAAKHVEGPFLAVWWHSPALAYFSGRPGVAGSSHQSLPGIKDSERFFTTADFGKVYEILKKRQVAFVVAGDVFPITDNGSQSSPPEMPMARVLSERPHSAPPYLRVIHANARFKVFRVYLDKSSSQ